MAKIYLEKMNELRILTNFIMKKIREIRENSCRKQKQNHGKHKIHQS
jgi:hypothetical protein